MADMYGRQEGCSATTHGKGERLYAFRWYSKRNPAMLWEGDVWAVSETYGREMALALARRHHWDAEIAWFGPTGITSDGPCRNHRGRQYGKKMRRQRGHRKHATPPRLTK